MLLKSRARFARAAQITRFCSFMFFIFASILSQPNSIINRLCKFWQFLMCLCNIELLRKWKASRKALPRVSLSIWISHSGLRHDFHNKNDKFFKITFFKSTESELNTNLCKKKPSWLATFKVKTLKTGNLNGCMMACLSISVIIKSLCVKLERLPTTGAKITSIEQFSFVMFSISKLFLLDFCGKFVILAAMRKQFLSALPSRSSSVFYQTKL